MMLLHWKLERLLGVGVEVDDHACDEECGSDVKIGFGKPAVVIVGRGDIEDPAALHQGVERIEQ